MYLCDGRSFGTGQINHVKPAGLDGTLRLGPRPEVNFINQQCYSDQDQPMILNKGEKCIYWGCRFLTIMVKF